MGMPTQMGEEEMGEEETWWDARFFERDSDKASRLSDELEVLCDDFDFPFFCDGIAFSASV
jgi:hypothetical protein